MDVKFARLAVVALDRKDSSYNKYWRCLCECGNTTVVREDKLKTGKVKSCGCLSQEVRKVLQVKALVEDRNYTRSSYQGMMYRCHNKNSASYEEYGGSGIEVCDRWRFGDGVNNGWTCFFMDMGPRPRGKTIDRIDGSKGYSPDNCRWATAEEQTINRKTTKLTFDDVSDIRSSDLSHGAVAKKFGIHRDHAKNIRKEKNWKTQEHPPS